MWWWAGPNFCHYCCQHTLNFSTSKQGVIKVPLWDLCKKNGDLLGKVDTELFDLAWLVLHCGALSVNFTLTTGLGHWHRAWQNISFWTAQVALQTSSQMSKIFLPSKTHFWRNMWNFPMDTRFKLRSHFWTVKSKLSSSTFSPMSSNY